MDFVLSDERTLDKPRISIEQNLTLSISICFSLRFYINLLSWREAFSMINTYLLTLQTTLIFFFFPLERNIKIEKKYVTNFP